MRRMELRTSTVRSAVAAGVFVLLAVATIAGWAPLDAADAAVSDWFRSAGTPRPRLIGAVRIATDVATTVAYLTAGLLATITLWVRRRRRAARFVAATTASVPLLWSLMHWLLVHPRPVDGFVVVTSNGFPSGHTSNAAAAALVAVILGRPLLDRRGRVALAVTAVLFALAVGVSRLVLLAHWPSDVVGGWLLAAAVVPPLAVWAGVGRTGQEPELPADPEQA